MKLKKIFFLLATFISTLAIAQLKPKMEVSNTKPIAPSITPFDAKASSRNFEGETKYLSLNYQNLKAANLGFKILALDDNGNPIAIEGSSKNPSDRNLSFDDKLSKHLLDLAPVLGVASPTKEFQISTVQVDAITPGNKQMIHVRMQQIWNEIPVYGSELIVHGTDQVIDFVNGRYIKRPEVLPLKPSLTQEQSTVAVSKDLGYILSEEDADLHTLKIVPNTIKLVYYQDKDKNVKLAYNHIVFKSIAERWEYLVDATTGDVLAKYPAMCMFHNHGKNHNCQDHTPHTPNSVDHGETTAMMDGAATANAVDLFNITRSINTYQVGNKYYLIDGSRTMFNTNSALPDDPIGAIWTIDAFNSSPQKDNFNYDHVTSSNNAWSSKTSVSAHYNGGKAYEYFKKTYNRNSIDGSGGTIISFINIADEDGSSLGNAFWNGAAMFYGNGDSAFNPLARGLDVAGHEMAHGVVQNTANLVYQGEAGALNESFADVFGTMIDREDWKIGEDVVKTSAFPSGALRSLEDPHNGAATGQFDKGWQPKKYSERYTGTQDNGGVHLNSGIPNHAFFLFASNAAVGKEKAEQVYYKALSSYLTKSSQFVDARIAVVKAAKEIYGDVVANAATAAFDAVEIPGGSGTNTQTDVEQNGGLDLILFTSEAKDNLYLYTATGQELGNPLSEKNPISKPSITDDGSFIVFVDNTNKIQYIQIDWAQGQSSEGTLNTGNQLFRNVAVSKDGKRLAALAKDVNNEMIVYDLESGNGAIFELKNPTFTTGVSTGDVNYADALEWDFTGERVMYDAENEIKSTTAGTINYWDIGFIKVWNKSAKAFALPDQIEKLFPALDEGESVGNPTFSKNSPYIIALDYLNGNDISVLGVNLETGDIGLVAANAMTIGYPSFANKDNKIIYDSEPGFQTDLYLVDLNTSKIKGIANTITEYTTDARWGVWFSNGKRTVTAIKNIKPDLNQISLSPNPVDNLLTIRSNESVLGVAYTITNVSGMLMGSGTIKSTNQEISLEHLKNGLYFFSTIGENGNSNTVIFIKQ